jgi:cystine transport system ATP-binding protein
MTMLMATHDLRLAESIAHDVAFLEGGEIVERAPPEVIFRRPIDPRTVRFVETLTGERTASGGAEEAEPPRS